MRGGSPTGVPVVGQADVALYKFGAACFAIGAVSGGLAQVLHPLPDPEDPWSFLEVVSAATGWEFLHLVALASFLILLGGWLAIMRSLDGGRSWLGQLGMIAAVVGAASTTVWMAVDGIAVKVIADLRTAAPPAEQPLYAHVARGVEEVIFGLFSLSVVIYFGLPFVLFGLALLRSDRYPRWVGALTLVAGLGSSFVGTAQAFTGRDALVTHVLIPIVVVFASLVSVLLAVFLWRLARAHPPATTASDAESGPVHGAPARRGSGT